MKRKLPKFIKIIITICLVILVVIGGSLIYVNDYYHAKEDALNYIEQVNDSITVDTSKKNQISFIPSTIEAGFIFYPGGKVQYESYAPILYKLAENKILSVLVHMPGNLAVLNQNAADGIQEQFTSVSDWYIGGHSLGGAMAASYVSKHIDEYEGLALFAAYSTADLSSSNLKVISIYGSEDGVMNKEKYDKYKTNLPSSLSENVIEGGCHAYFGDYGFQKGDGNPTISKQEQWIKSTNLLVEWIKK